MSYLSENAKNNSAQTRKIRLSEMLLCLADKGSENAQTCYTKQNRLYKAVLKLIIKKFIK